jgi:hypothetical protein
MPAYGKMTSVHRGAGHIAALLGSIPSIRPWASMVASFGLPLRLKVRALDVPARPLQEMGQYAGRLCAPTPQRPAIARRLPALKNGIGDGLVAMAGALRCHGCLEWPGRTIARLLELDQTR